MKKIIILMLAVLGYECSDDGNEYDMNTPPPYELGVVVELKRLKDPMVKYIKVAVKGIDKIVPKYEVFLTAFSFGDLQYDKTKDTYFITQQRKARTVDFGDGNKTYYFGGLHLRFGLRNGDFRYILGKERIFELKIYKNNELFLTKKITLRSNKNPDFKYGNYSYSDNVFFQHTLTR